MPSKLASTLRTLDAAIKKRYPRKYAALEKPASKKAVDQLEKGFGRPIPDEVRTLYSWRGGARGLLVDRKTNAADEGWDFNPPAVVLEDYRAWCKAKRPAKSWKSTWLPVFGNGAGDNVCIDVESGKLVEALHEDDDARPIVAKNLNEAMAYVLKRVTAGSWGGSPETKKVSTLITTFEKFDHDKAKVRFDSLLGGNEMTSIMQTDPTAAIAVLDAAENCLARWLDLGADFRARYQNEIQRWRALAYIRLEEANEAYAAYQALLATARKAGCIIDGLNRIGEGFKQLEQRAWAEDVARVLAMDGTTVPCTSDYGDVYDRSLLDCWLAAEATLPDEDWTKRRTNAMTALVEQTDGGLAAATNGTTASHCWVVKAAALRELRKKAASSKAWEAAAAADRKIANFWRTHALIA